MSDKNDEPTRDDHNKSPENKIDTSQHVNSHEETDSESYENLPPEVKKVVEMGFSMQRYSGPAPNPLFSKLTENHIDKILELSAKEDTNSYKDSQNSRKYTAFYFVAILALFIFLVIFLIDKDKALLMTIVEKVIFVLAGFAGGYGYKAFRDNKAQNQ
ncbi:MAG: hypothetical protein K9G70_14870 [Prolixibacteraceae bacterium]|nr:hypothetical protein [Prolixibacteraceae bacterium]